MLIMNSWIFQGNPDKFQIDTYVEQNERILWGVRQEHHAASMDIGDEVFLWRSEGRAGAVAGVVAGARVVEAPRVQLNDPAS